MSRHACLPTFALFQTSVWNSASVEDMVTRIIQNPCQNLTAGVAIGAVADGVRVRLSTSADSLNVRSLGPLAAKGDVSIHYSWMDDCEKH